MDLKIIQSATGGSGKNLLHVSQITSARLHKNKLTSIYKHNESIKVKKGDFVMSGEVIALSGNTGELTTGPHLHFEIWDSQGPLNPEDLISF